MPETGLEVSDLVRKWTPYAESWARRMERRYPGSDFWPAASKAMHVAMIAFDPTRGASFVSFLNANLRNQQSGPIRLWTRRNAKLGTRQPIGEVWIIDAGLTAIERREDRKRIDDALQTLPERTREWVIRRYLGGEHFGAIAGDYGLTESWVAKVIQRGLKQVREQFTPAIRTFATDSDTTPSYRH